MSLKLVFSVKLLTDYHVSTGAGLGKNIDSALFRDHTGRPSLRGSTLAGLFRSAGQELGRLAPQLQQTINEIFENKQHIKSWAFRSAEMVQDDLMNIQVGESRFSNVRVGVRIDPVSRRAQDKKFFNKEFGSAGIEFIFEVEHIGQPGQEKDEAALLLATARLIRSLGSGINRGAGKCLLTLKSIQGIERTITQEELFEHLKRMLEGQQRETTFGLTVAKQTIANTYTYTSHRYRVVLKSLEPIIITNGGRDGTEYDTLNYIPGTTVLGAIANKYIKQNSIEGEAYNDFLHLFKRGGLVFSPLYPVVLDEVDRSSLLPTIPIPQDMLTCKRKPNFSTYCHENEIRGYACLQETSSYKCLICSKGLAEVPLINVEGFLPVRWNIGSKVQKLESQKNYEPHLAMQDNERRANDGSFYAYNVLPAGSLYYGEIYAHDPEHLKQILQLMENENEGYESELLIGKGITRGYGRVKMHLEPCPESKLNPEPIEKRVKSLDSVTLYFLSDTIVVDPWGRCISGFDSAVLSKMLSLEVEMIQAFVSLKEIEGFSGITGLPKFRDMAIKAGSAIGFKVVSGELTDLLVKLSGIEQQGMGFRTHEGFGRVAFNHVVYHMEDFSHGIRCVRNPYYVSDSSQPEVWSKIKTRLHTRYLNRTLDKSFDRSLARWLNNHKHLNVEKLKERLCLYGTLNILEGFGISARDKRDGIAEFVRLANEEIEALNEILKRKLADHNLEQSEELWKRTIEWFASHIIACEKAGEING